MAPNSRRTARSDTRRPRQAESPIGTYHQEPACAEACTGELTCPTGPSSSTPGWSCPTVRRLDTPIWCPSEGEAPAVTDSLVATAFQPHPPPTLDLLHPAAGRADAGELRDELLHQERADAQPDGPAARAAGGPADRGALLHLALRRRRRRSRRASRGRRTRGCRSRTTTCRPGGTGRRSTRPGSRTTGSTAAAGGRCRAA